MKLCMFSPRDQDLERGWPGRIAGETVIQLAAQTLQAFFTGGGIAREHAEYPLADVVFRAPVLHPPSVRIFDEDGDFVFANPAAIKPDGEDPGVPGAERVARVAATTSGPTARSASRRSASGSRRSCTVPSSATSLSRSVRL